MRCLRHRNIDNAMTSPASRDTAVITGMRTEVFGDPVGCTPDGKDTMVAETEVVDDVEDSTPDGRDEGEPGAVGSTLGASSISEYCNPAFVKCLVQLDCHWYGLEYDHRRSRSDF